MPSLSALLLGTANNPSRNSNPCLTLARNPPCRQLTAALAALWEAQRAVVERLGPFESWSKSDLARWAGAAAMLVEKMPECLLNARPELFGQMVAGVRCLVSWVAAAFPLPSCFDGTGKELCMAAACISETCLHLPLLVQIADGTEEESLKILNTVLLKGARSSTPQAGHLAVAALRDGLVADALELPGRLLASGVQLSGSTVSRQAALLDEQSNVRAKKTSACSARTPPLPTANACRSLPCATALQACLVGCALRCSRPLSQQPAP